MKFLSLLLLCLLFITGCKEAETIPNQAPEAFAVQVFLAGDGTTVNLSWNNAKDPNGDSIKYTVILGDTLAIKITDTTYVINDLGYDYNNTGYVIADDGNGLATKATFSVSTQKDPGFVFFAIDNVFYALNPQNGNLRWKYSALGNLFPPLIHNEIIYLFSSSSNGDNVIVLDKSGKVLKSIKPTQNSIRVPPIIKGDTLIIGDEGGIYALDLNLQPLWKIKNTNPYKKNISVGGKYIIETDLYGSSINLYSSIDGTFQDYYSSRKDNITTASPVKYYQGNIYFTGTFINRITNSYEHERVISISLSSKTIKWNKYVWNSSNSNSPLIFSGNLVVPSSTSNYVFCNLTDGKVTKDFFIKNMTGRCSPSIKNDIIYQSERKSIFAFSLIENKKIWEHELSGSKYTSSCVVSDKRVVVLSESKLKCFNPITGNELWNFDFNPIKTAYGEPCIFEDAKMWYPSSSPMYKNDVLN